MQKVHGPAIDPPDETRHGYLDHPGALVISVVLFLAIYAIVYFDFFGGP